MIQRIKLISLGAALLAGSLLHAQTDLSNNDTLAIGPGAILYVTGSFNNSASAKFSNRGNLHIQQGITNAQPSMVTGDGSLYLTGTTVQTLNGTQPFSTFNLITGNAAGIVLNNDLRVFGLHTFNSGIITTAVTPTVRYLSYEAGASFIGDGDAKHVNGSVRKSGNTAFYFPVGNGVVERSVAIKDLSAASVFEARYSLSTPNASNITSPLVNVDRYEYWIVNKTSGGTAKIDLNWDNNKITMRPYVLADIRVAGFAGSVWAQQGGGATGNVATTGVVSSNALSAFGPFTFASISEAVPVKITDFTATVIPAGNLVKWTTTDAINLSHFNLQRSDDRINFSSIAIVPAQNGAALRQYQFLDTRPMQVPVVYYRLQIVESSGDAQFSKIIFVKNTTITDPAYAVNPAHRNIDLMILDVSGKLTYKINTTLGQTLQQGVLNVDLPGKYTIPLQHPVSKGIYILQLEQPGFKYTQRLMID